MSETSTRKVQFQFDERSLQPLYYMGVDQGCEIRLADGRTLCYTFSPHHKPRSARPCEEEADAYGRSMVRLFNRRRELDRAASALRTLVDAMIAESEMVRRNTGDEECAVVLDEIRDAFVDAKSALAALAKSREGERSAEIWKAERTESNQGD